MVKQVLKCKITQTLLGSVIQSYREYVRICDFTMGVYETPEYWYTTGITRALAKNYTSKNIYPVLEDSMTGITSHRYEGQKGRFPNKLRKSGRTDIALWRYNYTEDDWEPISVIEVKRGWGWGGDPFKKDIERIISSIDKLGKRNKAGSLDGGFFIVVSDYWEKTRKEMIEKFEKDFDNIWDKIDDIIDDDHHKFNGYMEYSEYNKENETMGAVMVFKFR